MLVQGCFKIRTDECPIMQQFDEFKGLRFVDKPNNFKSLYIYFLQ